eukprot:6801062-Alexandrium_andersonii.AAC.1
MGGRGGSCVPRSIRGLESCGHGGGSRAQEGYFAVQRAVVCSSGGLLRGFRRARFHPELVLTQRRAQRRD